VIVITFFNSLVRKKQEFIPIREGEVKIYTCGPTVYDYAHIGNLRSYIFADVLKRVLLYNGYKVKHIINITDVGHLVSDADEGEDKMMRALKREGLEPSIESMKLLADRYARAFKENLRDLEIIFPNKFTKASEYIGEMISLIKRLEDNGFTYQTKQGIYFDISKFPEYKNLFQGQALEEKIVGIRTDVGRDPEKKHPADFALWFFLYGDFEKAVQHWSSPWGEGFPGWHIECSAMSMAELGEKFDIHTGGIDHITKHHPNEVAQNWGATGGYAVNYWLHNDFVIVGGTGRMAKSAGTFITLSSLKEKNFNPLAYRYLLLLAHYRTKIDFSWEALGSAQNALFKIYGFIQKLNQIPSVFPRSEIIEQTIENYQKEFSKYINNDLDMPKAVALIHKLMDKVNERLIHENINVQNVLGLLLNFDRVLGLRFEKILEIKLGAEDQRNIELRNKARAEKDFKRADDIREELLKKGIELEDMIFGTIWKKIRYDFLQS